MTDRIARWPISWRLPPPPVGEAGAIAAAAAAGFVIPDACLPGVADNLALLTRHAGVLRS